jgi:hypothetical protein
MIPTRPPFWTTGKQPIPLTSMRLGGFFDGGVRRDRHWISGHRSLHERIVEMRGALPDVAVGDYPQNSFRFDHWQMFEAFGLHNRPSGDKRIGQAHMARIRRHSLSYPHVAHCQQFICQLLYGESLLGSQLPACDGRMRNCRRHPLYRIQILDDLANLALEILLACLMRGPSVVKAPSPHRHVSRTMCRDVLAAIDEARDGGGGKRHSVTFPEITQIGRRRRWRRGRARRHRYRDMRRSSVGKAGARVQSTAGPTATR